MEEAPKHNRYKGSCYSSEEPEVDCAIDIGYLKRLQEQVANEARSRDVEAPVEKTRPPKARLVHGIRQLAVKRWDAMRDDDADNPPGVGAVDG